MRIWLSIILSCPPFIPNRTQSPTSHPLLLPSFRGSIEFRIEQDPSILECGRMWIESDNKWIRQNPSVLWVWEDSRSQCLWYVWSTKSWTRINIMIRRIAIIARNWSTGSMRVLLRYTPKLTIIYRCSMHHIGAGNGMAKGLSSIVILSSIVSKIPKEIPNFIKSLSKQTSQTARVHNLNMTPIFIIKTLKNHLTNFPFLKISIDTLSMKVIQSTQVSLKYFMLILREIENCHLF